MMRAKQLDHDTTLMHGPLPEKDQSGAGGQPEGRGARGKAVAERSFLMDAIS